MVEDIAQRVIDMITIHSGTYLLRKKKYDSYTASSNIYFDVKLSQDDIEELIEDYAKTFNVDMSDFRLRHTTRKLFSHGILLKSLSP